ERFGRQLHELGLTLGLRDDAIDEYHDESNYSYINVADRTENGQRVNVLRLDKLVHSYFVPDDPTQLNYEYEKVYAAVTEHAVSTWDRTTTVSLNAVRQEIEQRRNGANNRIPPASPATSNSSPMPPTDPAKALDEEVEGILFTTNEGPSVPVPTLDDLCRQLQPWIT